MSSWLRTFHPDPTAPTRLFCLPYAGGGASLYRNWGPALAGVAEVVAVQLPGRENRVDEPALSRMREVVPRLTDAIGAMQDRPFALFGYSMGARVAHSVAAALHDGGLSAPSRLFVAASAGPAAPPARAVHALAKPEFLTHLRALGGTPDEFFANPELLELTLPALRADLAVVETATHPPRPSLLCPVHALVGQWDREATVQRMAAWRAETVGTFTLTTFAAGHFFLHSHLDALLERVRSDLVVAATPLAGAR